ncbi:MAG: response regulator, partial [Bacteroidota bacterium]
ATTTLPAEIETSNGSLATTTLPAEIETSNAIASSAAPEPTLPTILVVEDNPDMREFIAQALQSNFNILKAEDGEKGYQMANDQDPDLIVSDVMMPKMNGTDMCQQLKTDTKTSHIPVILLTAKADRSSKLQGLEIGADDYLAKPFDDEELRLIIRNRIAQRRKLKAQFKATPGNIQLKELGMTSADEKFLQEAIKIVENNLGDPNFQVENLCREIGFSQRHLHRKLTALTDLGPNQFIRHVRLKRAADRIRNKTDKISQIAFEVGFNNMSYFNRCFKEQFGVTPGEYGLQPLPQAQE